MTRYRVYSVPLYFLFISVYFVCLPRSLFLFSGNIRQTVPLFQFREMGDKTRRLQVTLKGDEEENAV